MNGGNFLVASVISIQNSNFVYPSCHSCFSKVSLQFKRYNCQKCGCSGDTKEANYRYRLSLEVADTPDLFEVTVFGSCLDTYFGATAKGLQRVPRSPVWLAHCKMAAPKPSPPVKCSYPHPGLVGYTVIFYIEQQRTSPFQRSPGASQPPDHVLASDPPSGELKSLHLSDDLDVTRSSHRSGFLTLWSYSFGLTWPSTSSEDAERSAGLESREPGSEKQNGEGGSVTSHGQSVYNFRGPNSTQDEGVVDEVKKSCWFPPSESLPPKDELLRSRPAIKGKDGDILVSPFASEWKDSSCKISIPSSYGLANPWPPLPHHGPEELLASSSSPGATGGATSQGSSEGWIGFLTKLDDGKSAADLPNGQEQRPASVLSEKPGENKESELLAEERGGSWRGKGVCRFPRVGSSGPQASFDASADLFEISAGGSTKSTPATSRGPRIVPPSADALTPNCVTSESVAREGKGSANWTTSPYGLSLCDRVDVSAPKTSTPIAGSGFKSECGPVDSVDFTSPASRSIPLARPCHPGSLPAGEGSLVSELPLSKWPWDKAQCKRSRLLLKNSLVKQLISKFSPSAGSSSAEAGMGNPRGPLSRLSAQGSLSEDGGQEWSLPLGQIQDQEVKSWRRKRRKNFIGLHSDDGQVLEGSLSPRNLSKLAKVGFLPKKPPPEKADVEGQPRGQWRTMLGPPADSSPDRPPSADFSRSTLLPTPSPVPHVADWSSELFSGHDQLPKVEATVSWPTS